MSRKSVGREMLDNMSMTREQYENACSLIDELCMEKGDFPRKPTEWEQIESSFGQII